MCDNKEIKKLKKKLAALERAARLATRRGRTIPDLEKKVRAFEAIHAAVGEAVKYGDHGKPFDLYWLGRRNVQAVLEDQTHGSHTGVVHVMKMYPKAAASIAKGNPWKHGFNAGVVAFARLVSGLANPTEIYENNSVEQLNSTGFNVRCAFDKLSETEQSELRQDGFDDAWEEYPMLDT